MATELTSTTITNILEAVPGIKTVLRSPAADAMVNLTRAAAGVGLFEIKDARELMRFAFRRGLINNEEHDKVLSDIDGVVQARRDRLAARQSARDDKRRTPSRSKAAKARHVKSKVAKARHVKSKAAKARHVRSKAAKARHVKSKTAKARHVRSKTAKAKHPKPRVARAPKKSNAVPRKAAKSAPKKRH